MDEAKLRELLEQFIKDLLPLLQEVKEEAKKEEGPLSKRSLLELISHEAIVLEAYRDSKGIWTWGIGVTDESGHKVARYKDNPSDLSKVIEIFKWLVETKYLPDVLEAFKGVTLKEHELAAALSFHYNTGAIKRAAWVQSFLKGDVVRAKREFLNWRSPPEIIPRREKERDLFFEGKWTSDGTTSVYPVRKPSYKPNWSGAKRINISKEL